MVASPRQLCSRCKRPPTVCYCAHLAELPTKTKVVLLQHPRETGNAIGTAWMARLCLPNSELHVGVDFANNANVVDALNNPDAPAVLLYPGADATDILQAPPTHPVTLVVVDGTWSQAKSVVRRNPMLASLPRYAFAAPKPSEYRIRKEPSDEVVSTIESLMYSLGAIEGEPQKFADLMRPFRAMISRQMEFYGAKRTRRKRIHQPKPTSLALAALRERQADIVCIVGEVNAWPYQLGRHRERDELAHLVAYRMRTNERYGALAVPSHGWSPSVTRTLGLAEPALLAAAQSPAALRAGFANFLRPDDIVVTWSWFTPRTLGSGGFELPTSVFDARRLLEECLRKRVPRLDAVAAAIGTAVAPLEVSSNDATPHAATVFAGRAWARMAALVAATNHVVTIG